jgi:hypothetical protein
MVSAQRADLPPSVTFEDAARLLVELGIDSNATGDSVRYLARIRSKTTWPFGDRDGQTPYGKASNARTMDTAILLKHLEEEPPNPHRRGRDKKPRTRTTEPS